MSACLCFSVSVHRSFWLWDAESDDHHFVFAHPTQVDDQIASMTHGNKLRSRTPILLCLSLYVSVCLTLSASLCLSFYPYLTHLLRSRTKKSVNDLSSRAHAHTHAHTRHCTAGARRHDDSTHAHTVCLFMCLCVSVSPSVYVSLADALAHFLFPL